jgi:hypothetical protein
VAKAFSLGLKPDTVFAERLVRAEFNIVTTIARLEMTNKWR